MVSQQSEAQFSSCSLLVLHRVRSLLHHQLRRTECSGRVPGYSQTDIKLLPSSVSKRGIWKVYQAAATCDSIRAVAYPTFTCLWRSLLPSIILMWAMTDLCWQCQKGSMVIQRSVNLSKEEKSDAVRSAQEHL